MYYEAKKSEKETYFLKYFLHLIGVYMAIHCPISYWHIKIEHNGSNDKSLMVNINPLGV